MLYLEDYLEMIEHLPQELRDRFTEMREMDLQVQNAIDSLDSRVKEFFLACKKLKQGDRDTEYEKIDQDYYKALEDADEKVHIANQIYELLERYIRKLDQELQKFKMELEADNAGITEILEQRSYDLDKAPVMSCSMPVNSNNIKAEKRKHSQITSSLGYTSERQIERTDKVLSSLATEVIRETITGNRISLTPQSPTVPSINTSTTPSLPEKTVILAQPKASPFGGGNALAAAASQAIAATQQSLKRSSSQSQSSLIQQGRRSASLKASYEAINSGLPNLKDFNISARDMATMQTVTANTSNIISSLGEPKTKTKKTSRASTASQPIETALGMEDSGDSSTVDETIESVDWNYDPNEPRYCICNQVSYGDMVACDNTDCPFEWFHYQCVGITQPPKGKWYCPQCTSSMKRRGRKDR